MGSKNILQNISYFYSQNRGIFNILSNSIIEISSSFIYEFHNIKALKLSA